MLALGIRQHQRARDAVQHVGRGRPAAALLEPGVPGRADVGALRHLFAPEPRRAPTRQRNAERGRIEFCTAVPEEGSSITRDQAKDHFGWFAMFAGMDSAASSERTRKALGWEPQQPGLLADLDQPSYFEG